MALDARTLEKTLTGSDKPRTLVVAPNWVGDTIMALPVLEALAGAQRALHVLARPHLESLLDLVPSVTAVIRRGEDAETIELIRESHCREAFILPNSFRSAWLPYRAGLAARYGYRGSLRRWLLSPAVRPPERRDHQVEDYEELLAAAGILPPEEWHPHLQTDEAARTAGRDALERGGVQKAGGPLIGIFPGAEFGPSKRWPWQRFAELTHLLRRRMRDARLLLLAGPKEVWSTVRIHEASGKLVPVLGADLDLGQLAGLLECLDLLITNDSGPMHMAAALGVPCVSIFGPTDPRRTRPYGDAHEVLYTDRWCSPCFRKRCPLLHQKCMKDIEVDLVADAAVAAVNRS